MTPPARHAMQGAPTCARHRHPRRPARLHPARADAPRADAARQDWPAPPDAPTSAGSSPARHTAAQRWPDTAWSTSRRPARAPAAPTEWHWPAQSRCARPSAPIRYGPSPLRPAYPTGWCARPVRTGPGRLSRRQNAWRLPSSPHALPRRLHAAGAPARKLCRPRSRRIRQAGYGDGQDSCRDGLTIAQSTSLPD